MMISSDAESCLEKATLDLFLELDWETANGYYEVCGKEPNLG